jgi:hypothetical protein
VSESRDQIGILAPAGAAALLADGTVAGRWVLDPAGSRAEFHVAVHGAQKLFGAFGGPGLEKTAAGFERIGLAPGRQMAALAGAAELAGGLLTVAGAADPADRVNQHLRVVAARAHRVSPEFLFCALSTQVALTPPERQSGGSARVTDALF